jgi:hypothetical protein
LQVGMSARGLLAEIRRPLHGAHRATEESLFIQVKYRQNMALHFCERGTPIK